MPSTRATGMHAASAGIRSHTLACMWVGWAACLQQHNPSGQGAVPTCHIYIASWRACAAACGAAGPAAAAAQAADALRSCTSTVQRTQLRACVLPACIQKLGTATTRPVQHVRRASSSPSRGFAPHVVRCHTSRRTTPRPHMPWTDRAGRAAEGGAAAQGPPSSGMRRQRVEVGGVRGRAVAALMLAEQMWGRGQRCEGPHFSSAPAACCLGPA